MTIGERVVYQQNLLKHPRYDNDKFNRKVKKKNVREYGNERTRI